MSDLAERIEQGLPYRSDAYAEIAKLLSTVFEDRVIAAAYYNSLGDCNILMEKVLPGWGWCLNSEGKQGFLFRLFKSDDQLKASYAGLAKTPAQAWLAAIVRAVESEANNDK